MSRDFCWFLATVFAVLSTVCMFLRHSDPLGLQWAILFLVWDVLFVVLATRK